MKIGVSMNLMVKYTSLTYSSQVARLAAVADLEPKEISDDLLENFPVFEDAAIVSPPSLAFPAHRDYRPGLSPFESSFDTSACFSR